MKKVRSILCLLLVLMMAVSLFACAKQDDTKPADEGKTDTTPAQDSKPAEDTKPVEDTAPADVVVSKPEVITVGTSILGRFLDGAEPSPNLHACDAVYDSLFLIKQDGSAEPYSYILDSWEWKDDVTFTMTLKDGITFTNGDVATGEDLLFSVLQHMERQDISASSLGPLNPSKCSFEGNTVTLVFDEPWGPGVVSRNLYLFDKSWCVEKGWDSQDWYNNPNGSGPYKVTEFVTDDHITIELKDNYWNAANENFTVKKWIIKYFADQSTMFMALEKGEIQLCGVGSTDYDRLIADGNDEIGIKYCSGGGNMNCFVATAFNKDLQDINVRKALAYGVDWAAIGEVTYGARYRQPTSILVPGSPYYENVGAYEFDPEVAKAALAEGGYAAGDIKLHIYSMPSESYKNMCEAFQYYVSELGIECDIEFGDTTSALMTWMQDGTCDVGFYNNINGIPNCEPHESINCFYVKGFTWCLCYDQSIIDLCTKASHSVDPAVRDEAYAELQQRCHDEYLVFPVSEDGTLIGYRADTFTAEEIQAYTYSSSYTLLHPLSW